MGPTALPSVDARGLDVEGATAAGAGEGDSGVLGPGGEREGASSKEGGRRGGAGSAGAAAPVGRAEVRMEAFRRRVRATATAFRKSGSSKVVGGVRRNRSPCLQTPGPVRITGG